MTALALIHSPFVGPSAWSRVADELKRKGRRVLMPALANVVDEGPPHFERIAAAVASAVDAAGPTTLVAHSGAGALVPSIVETSRSAIVAIIFVDALLPHPGKCWLDTTPMVESLKQRAYEGRLPRWNEWFPPDMIATLLPQKDWRDQFIAELPRVPLSYAQEPAPETHAWRSLPIGFLQLSANYAKEAGEVSRAGWLVRNYPSDHLAIVTRPREIADNICALERDFST